LERRHSLRCVRESVDHAEPVWLRLDQVARYHLIG